MVYALNVVIRLCDWTLVNFLAHKSPVKLEDPPNISPPNISPPKIFSSLYKPGGFVRNFTVCYSKGVAINGILFYKSICRKRTL